VSLIAMMAASPLLNFVLGVIAGAGLVIGSLKQ
jgi:hypothetical protein